MTRVGVLGAGGRMGQEVCRTVARHPGLELVAATDPAFAGIDLRQVTGVDVPGLHIAADIEELERADAEVAVDFTVADSARRNLRWCAAHGVHAVVGTTGIGDADIAELRGLFEDSKANCIVAANFAIGAVLLMRFCELAAPYMEGAEIVELHHDGKLDAPSGTALRTATAMADARAASGEAAWPGDATEHAVLASARGAEAPGGVRIHSVRLPGLVAHQEVVMGAVGQSLTMRHDSYDRSSFMPGVLMAIAAVGERPGLTVGLAQMLGF